MAGTMMFSYDSQLECNQFHSVCIFFMISIFILNMSRKVYVLIVISKMWGITEQLRAVATVSNCVNKT